MDLRVTRVFATLVALFLASGAGSAALADSM